MKILQAASEVVPFAKTGGLADVAGALPLALEKLGHEVIITLPKYKAVDEKKFKIQRLNEGVSFTTIGKGIKVFFLENDSYFNRDGLYGDKSGDHKDNLERFSCYCRKTIELLKLIKFKPDIVHVHDWQASLIPVYLKSVYAQDAFFKNTKTILTVHNIGYQGLFAKEEFGKLMLDSKLFSIEGLEFYGKINILKGGMVFSDIVNTVSPTYSKEIQTKEFGFGLEGVLNKRKGSVFGVLNGLDYSIWDPEKDKFIIKNYSLKNLEDKYKSKQDLQKTCGLPVKNEVPLLGIVSRLAEQKGFDILTQAIEKICKMGVQLVILGTGDIKYHQLLEASVKKYPKTISLHLKFDDSLAHKIYAGSDIFLMPSKYEPCGLGQMISLKYATIPLVFKTGGLADTVNAENGFVFDKYTKDDLIKTLGLALKAFADKKKWLKLMQKAIEYDFSWQEAAKKYLGLYEKARSL